MKRLAARFGLALALALPGSAMAFHHGGLPATDCHAESAGSPSNDNGMAKEALLAHNPQGLPLRRSGRPGTDRATVASTARTPTTTDRLAPPAPGAGRVEEREGRSARSGEAKLSNC